MLTNLLNFSNLYFIFQHDLDCKNSFSNHQNSETDQSGEQAHQYVEGKDHDLYQLDIESKNPSSHQQNLETYSEDQIKQYVAQYEEYHSYNQHHLEKDPVLLNNYAHSNSDLDFLRYPFVNQEYFTD